MALTALNLQAGTNYYFQLNVNSGYSIFQIYNQPWVPTNKKVGGLRIKEIKTNDGVSVANDIVKQYDYSLPINPAASSGKLMQKPRYTMYNVYPIISSNYCVTGAGEQIVFSDESIVPLYSFEGNHIGYNYVKETQSGNGYNVGNGTKLFNFFVGTPSFQDPIFIPYPTPPYNPISSNGNISNLKISSTTGTVLKETANFPYSTDFTNPIYNIGKIRKVIRISVASTPSSDGADCGTLAAFFQTDYQIRTQAYRLLSTTETLDGLATTTNHTYSTDAAQPLFPLTTAMTNSDGKVTVSTNKYITDPSVSSPAKAVMVNRNIIASPVESTVSVAGVVTGGSKTVFDLFNGNPYPTEFWKYKMTWDVSGNANVLGWEKEGSITSYTTKGQPLSITLRGWENATGTATETYTWNATNNMIATRTFKGFTWQYAYFPNTRMVQKITNIDGQFTTFAYDDLQRLTTSSARGGAVTTQNLYKYQDATQRKAIKTGLKQKSPFRQPSEDPSVITRLLRP